jgi:hypothetical protein
MAYSKPQSRTVPEPSVIHPILRFLGVSVLALSLAYVLFLAVRYSNSTNSEWASSGSSVAALAKNRQKKASAELLPNSLGEIAEPAPGNAAPAGRIAQSRFSLAFNRLDRTFHSHGNSQPEHLLAMANANSKGAQKPCPITWNNGEPAMQLSSGFDGNLSLAGTLDRCAAAVEALP